MRYFETGATRDDDSNKLDYEGFFNPLVLQARAEYMHKHRKQADGKLRNSDNWQKGMPSEAYVKSLFRHFHDVWLEHRGYKSREGMVDAICAAMFNLEGLLLNILREGQNDLPNGRSAESSDSADPGRRPERNAKHRSDRVPQGKTRRRLRRVR